MKKRIVAIDGLRGVAILMVMFYHGRSWIPGIPDIPSYHPINLLKFGYSGVDLFFVLSGFSLYYAWCLHRFNHTESTLSSYYSRRFWRIYPPYIIAFLIPFFMHFHKDMSWLLKEFLSHIALVQNFSVSHFYGANGPLWSIAVEAQFYLVFPFIVFLFHKYGTLKITLLIIFISFLYRFGVFLEFSDFTYRQVPKPYLQGFLLARMPNFVLGMWLADLFINTRKYKYVNTRPFFTGLTIMLITWLSIYLFRHVSMVWRELGFALAYTFMVLGILKNPYLSKVLSSKWIVFIGTISFSLYLTHAPLIMFFNKIRIFIGIHVIYAWYYWFVLVLIYFTVCILIAWGYYNLIEKRSLHLSHKFSR